MKHIFSLIFMLGMVQLQGQECNEGNHDTQISDSWTSCEITMSPNPERGVSHWIRYDLGYVYALSTTHFWNYNVAAATEKGMKDIIIDYSLDGINWTEVAAFQLPQATGSDDYPGTEGPNLGNIEARYILITGLTAWGDINCAGLSEVRFDIGEANGIEPLNGNDGVLELFPNPVNELLNIKSDIDLEELVIVDGAGHEVYRSPFQSTIDLKSLPSGLYFVKGIGPGKVMVIRRFIKI